MQDDLENWSAEAATMGEVYRNAAFCIAATAAKNCDFGLFVDRDLNHRSPVRVNIRWRQIAGSKHSVLDGDYALCTEWISATFNIDDAPLNQRAWV
jgi:hypothetical protein